MIPSNMQAENFKDKLQRKKKGRTWSEAAQMVLEKYPLTPMSHKEVLKVIQRESLKDISGTAPLACLNAMLHSNSRGNDCTFYKVAGRMGVYGLMNALPEGAVLQEMDEDENMADMNIDEDGRPVPGGPKTARERKKEKVMYVKLPDGYSTIPPAPEPRHKGDHLSKEAMEGVTSGTEQTTLSEASGAESQLSVIQEVQGVQEVEGAQVSRPQRRRAGRNNTLRHYKRRKKKTKIRKLKIKPVLPPSDYDTPSPSLNGPESSAASTCSTSSSSQSGNNAGHTTSPRPPQKPSLRDVLASIPGFSLRPRKRTGQKLSTAAQIRQTREGCIDLETPNSILVQTNLKALINNKTFMSLPPAYQYKLVQLLPDTDRHVSSDGALRMGSTALNNEFFTKACGEWRDRLAEGEFTPDNQQRIKNEEEKEFAKIDDWKLRHFEPVWGTKKVEKPVEPPAAKLVPPLTLLTTTTTTVISKPVTTPTVPPLKIRPPKAKLVSTMLKQRTISQNVAAVSSCQSATTSASQLLASMSKAAQHQQETKASVEATMTTQVAVSKEMTERLYSRPTVTVSTSLAMSPAPVVVSKPVVPSTVVTPVSLSSIAAKNQTLLQQLKRPLEVQTTETVIAPKKTKISPPVSAPPVSAPPVSAPPVCSQPVIASPPRVTPPVTPPSWVVPRPATPQPVSSPVHPPRTSPPEVAVSQGKPGGQKAPSLHPPRVVTPQPHGQTRTLAQIKAQTAARAQATAGQTRTLAQIKAQTKARVQARNAQMVARPRPNILSPPKPRQETAQEKTVPLNIEDRNLARSYAIVQQVIEESIHNNAKVNANEGQVPVAPALSPVLAQAHRLVTGGAGLVPQTVVTCVPTITVGGFQGQPVRQPVTHTLAEAPLSVAPTSQLPCRAVMSDNGTVKFVLAQPAAPVVAPTMVAQPNIMLAQQTLQPMSVTDTNPQMVITTSAPQPQTVYLMPDQKNLEVAGGVVMSSSSYQPAPSNISTVSSMAGPRQGHTAVVSRTVGGQTVTSHTLARKFVSGQAYTGLVSASPSVLTKSEVNQNVYKHVISTKPPNMTASNSMRNSKGMKVLRVSSPDGQKHILVQAGHRNGSSVITLPSRPQSVVGDPAGAEMDMTPPRASSAPPSNLSLEGKKIIKVVIRKPADASRTSGYAPDNGRNLAPSLSSSHPSLQRLLTQTDNKLFIKVPKRSESVPATQPLEMAAPVQTLTVNDPAELPEHIKLALERQRSYVHTSAHTNGGMYVQSDSVVVSMSNAGAAGMVAPPSSHHSILQQGGLTAAGLSSSRTGGLGADADNGEQAGGNCACNLKAMVMCTKCGAFCHNDCVGPLKLCVSCLITT